MKKALCTFMLLAAVEASSAVSYRLAGSASGMSARVLADGPRVRLDYGNGTLLLTTDGGKTMTLVDARTKTYSVMTVADLAGAEMKVSNVKSSARDLGDGGVVQGFPTRRWLVESSYDMTLDVMGQKVPMHVTMRSESWRTEKIPAAAASIGTARTTHTGVAAIDKMLQSLSPPNVKGFPLKEVTTIRNKPAGAAEQTVSYTVEAKEIRMNVAAPPAQFTVPAGYKKK